MSDPRDTSSCELPSGPADRDRSSGASDRDPSSGPAAGGPGRDASRIVRFDDFGWEGVTPRDYKAPGSDWAGVARHALIGAEDGTAPFHVRYFEVRPGGHTTYERHEHHHVIVPIRGRGAVRLGDRWEPIGFGDVVYIAPMDPHQLRCAGEEPFGFLCVVSARRDPPQPIEDASS